LLAINGRIGDHPPRPVIGGHHDRTATRHAKRFCLKFALLK
jgi:hypothetical protein